MISKSNILIFLAKIAEVYSIGVVKYTLVTFVSFIVVIIVFNLI